MMSSSETDDSSSKQTADSSGSWRDGTKELKKLRARNRRLSSASVQSLPCGTVAARRASQNRVSQIKLEERKSVSRETEHERTILRCAHLSASCDELCLDCISGPGEGGATTPNGAVNCAFASDADGEADADDESVSSALSASTSFASYGSDSFVRRSRSLSFASRSVSPSVASCSSPVRVGVAAAAFGFCQSPTGSGRVPSPFASQLARVSSTRLSNSTRRESSPFGAGLVALAPSSLVSCGRNERCEPSSVCVASCGTRCFSPGVSQCLVGSVSTGTASSPYSPSQLHPPSPLAAALPARPAAVASPSQPATPSRSASPASSGYLSSQSTNLANLANLPLPVANQTGCGGQCSPLNAAAVVSTCQGSPSTHRYRTTSNSLTLLPSRLDDVVGARRISLKRKFDELVASAAGNVDMDLGIRSDNVPQASTNTSSEVQSCDVHDEIASSDCAVAVKETADELLLMVAPPSLLDTPEPLDNGSSQSQLDAKRTRTDAQ